LILDAGEGERVEVHEAPGSPIEISPRAGPPSSQTGLILEVGRVEALDLPLWRSAPPEVELQTSCRRERRTSAPRLTDVHA
jgi:hypothetical protein